jgi:hypothetical protein
MTTKADAKRRVVLPGAAPGDVFDVRRQGDEDYLLVKLRAPEPKGRLSREECLRAMEAAPLRLSMSWNELKKLTREP